MDDYYARKEMILELASIGLPRDKVEEVLARSPFVSATAHMSPYELRRRLESAVKGICRPSDYFC